MNRSEMRMWIKRDEIDFIFGIGVQGDGLQEDSNKNFILQNLDL